jgi:hypothetical protein
VKFKAFWYGATAFDHKRSLLNRREQHKRTTI